MPVAANNKLIVKNTGYLYFRSFLLLAISLYTSRLVLQALGVDNYGIYNVVGGFVAMFTILSRAMSSASQRYITFALGETEEKNVRNVFQTCVNLHLFLAIIMVILLEAVGIWFVSAKLNIPPGREMAAVYVLQFSIASLFIYVICVPFDALVVAHEHMKAFAYIGIFEALAKLGIVSLLFYVSYDSLVFYCFLLLLCDIIKFLIYRFYCHKHFSESRKLERRIDKGLFKEMFAFSGWNLFGQGSYLLRNQGIDILMNLFFGVTVNAAKGVCNQVQNAVTNFVSNFQAALYPQVTKALAQDNIIRMHRLIISGSKISFFLLSMICIPLSLNLKEVLELWLVEVPQYTLEFIQLTLVFMLMDTQSRLLIHGIDSTGKIRNYQLIVGTTKLFALPITYVLLKMGGGVLSGLIVNIGLEVFCFGERLYFCRKQILLPVITFITKVTLRCIIVFVLAYGMSLIAFNYLDIHFFFDIIVSVVISALVIWFLGFSEEERSKLSDTVLSFVKNKINKRAS